MYIIRELTVLRDIVELVEATRGRVVKSSDVSRATIALLVLAMDCCSPLSMIIEV